MSTFRYDFTEDVRERESIKDIKREAITVTHSFTSSRQKNLLPDPDLFGARVTHIHTNTHAHDGRKYPRRDHCDSGLGGWLVG